jgi:hypothetical protein
MFDLIFKFLFKLGPTDIVRQIVLIEEDNIVAIIFLVVFTNQHFVDEHSSIGYGLFVGTINHMDDKVDFINSLQYLLLGDVISDVVHHFIVFVPQLKWGLVVMD